MVNYYPKRIVCLTEETTETLYLLGEEARIVGISGYTVRPARARKEKPMVSAFIDARIDKILALQPDLVIGFSDIQADIAQELIKKGITVWINNYRSIEGCLNMMVQLGALVGKSEKALKLVQNYNAQFDELEKEVSTWKEKPKVYFEEWDDPIITGIQWVSELIEKAGGVDLYKSKRHASLAKDRIVADIGEVPSKNPDIILASWCGKELDQKSLESRLGWSTITAIKNKQIFEINSSIILQPGPAALTEGLMQMHGIFKKWVKNQ